MNDVGENDNIVLQDQTNTKENGTNTEQTSDSKEEVHTSELSPAEEKYIDYSEDIGTLITEIQTINHRLDTITNLCIVGMIGIGLIAGILACNIFARYFIS